MLIAIEGCIAAGKSTVATGLADHRAQTLLLEQFEMNPFLRDFYQDPVGGAFETEFAFLLLHYHQLRKSERQILHQEVIADFHLGKDLLFAEMNMTGGELRAFRQLSAICQTKVASPDVLIFLSASLSLIVDRVRARGRDFEQETPSTYYAALIAKYEEFYERYEGTKVRIAMEDWDFVKRPELYSKLSSLIDVALSSDRELNG